MTSTTEVKVGDKVTVNGLEENKYSATATSPMVLKLANAKDLLFLLVFNPGNSMAAQGKSKEGEKGATRVRYGPLDAYRKAFAYEVVITLSPCFKGHLLLRWDFIVMRFQDENSLLWKRFRVAMKHKRAQIRAKEFVQMLPKPFDELTAKEDTAKFCLFLQEGKRGKGGEEIYLMSAFPPAIQRLPLKLLVLVVEYSEFSIARLSIPKRL
eukprot:jgi/Bigna1/79473/fgenesh1_pg.62_\